MSDLFLKIINMSISASWLVLAVLLLRFVLKKAPKWINVLLWGIVAVRLAFPFSIESALSLIPSAETISPGIMMDTVPSVQTGVPAINSVINPVIGSSLAPAPGASANPLQIWIPILSIVWVVGVVALLLYTAVSYWRLRHKVSEAVILRDNIYQSENVASPFVLGLFGPRIYLPYNMDGQDLSHVVAHEQAHIRRRDHWWKPLGFLLLTIHWFNPLMWLAYVLLCRDIELACDEKVIRELGNEQRANYTQALVACSVNRRMIAACPLAFGEVGVKERVKSVMNYKKPAFWVIVLAVIACIVVAVCFLTNPVGFQFDEATHTIVSANHFDMRNADDAVAVEMNPAQISELSSRLAGVKNTKKSDEYGGLTPGYQISALLEDGTYIRISGYSLSDNDMVDIEWNGERYVVSDGEFQDYLSRICAGEDVAVGSDESTPNKVTFEAEVLEIHDGYFLVKPEPSWALNSADQIEVPMKNMDPSLEPQVGDTIEIVCSGEILETYPARLSKVYSIKVALEAPTVTKWFDYLGNPSEMEGGLTTELPEYPGVTFQYTENQIIASKPFNNSDLTGHVILISGMPIWNAYFTDLTGDGYPDICATYTYGSGMIDSRIVICDYVNGASYELSDRGYHDFTLWQNDNDGQLYVNKRVYPNDELVSSGRLVFKDDCIQIEEVLSGDSDIPQMSFAGLEHGDTLIDEEVVEIGTNGAILEYQLTYTSPTIILEVGVVAKDGTEFSTTIQDGTGTGSIENIPAGRYQLFVRNVGCISNLPGKTVEGGAMVCKIATESVGPLVQSEIEEIALAQCKVNYDYIRTEFNDSEKRWSVEFWEYVGKVPTQTVLVDPDGAVIGIRYAE